MSKIKRILAFEYPSLMKEWDFDKNKDICSPDSVAPGCNKKVWWICPNKHSYSATINHRTAKNKPTGCPYCAHEKPWPGENDLKTLRPDLMNEWDTDANAQIGLYPDQLMINSNKKAFWKCKKGHKWSAIIESRVKMGNGCPMCAGQRAIPGENDLTTVYPEIARLWDHSKNDNIPSAYLPSSNKKAWWICPKGHPSYEQIISDKVAGHGCPVCSNQKIIPGINDLTTTNPELVSEWDTEKNDALGIKITECSRGTDKKVFWKCDKGHSWKALIYARTGKAYCGCPKCANEQRVSLCEDIIFHYVKQAFPESVQSFHADWLGTKEIDIYIPELKLGVEYDGVYWHANVARDIAKDQLAGAHGTQMIHFREEGCPELPGSISFPVKVGGQMSKLQIPLEEFFAYLKNNYDCEIDCAINVEDDELKIRAERHPGNTIAELHPELADEWDYQKNEPLTPDKVPAFSNRKYYWICKKGHSYTTTANHRSNGRGCPYCADKKVLRGFNDLETRHPELAKEWNKQNDRHPYEVLPKSHYLAKWNCPSGHVYESLVAVRTSGSGCPYCSTPARKVLPGFNDLKTKFPEVAAEWDYQKNQAAPEMVLPGDNRKYWFFCKNGHSWSATLNSRTHGGSGCPICNNTSKKIICLETEKTYSSISAASRETGISKSAIARCVKGEYEQAGGYHWKAA